MLLITILASPGTCYSVYADRYTSYSHVYKQATEMDASYKHGNNNHHIIMYTCVYIVLCNLCISPVLSLFNTGRTLTGVVLCLMQFVVLTIYRVLTNYL